LSPGLPRLNMTPVPANAFIKCRVPSEIKARVRAVADRQGVTESQLVKDLLERILRDAGINPPTAPPERASRPARLYVRLRPEDHARLVKRAEDRQMPSATYVSLLVRSHLRGVAPLPKTEYLALRASVAELGAIGRNLNQIARSINAGGKPNLPGASELESMVRLAARLGKEFTALLIANERSWDLSPTSS
jgi:Bacterial mobilisation protein (MobC)/RelB antitoxin